jgi:hypothetical protein
VVEVIATDEFADWYGALDDSAADDIEAGIGLLENRGVAIGFPYSSAIKGASFALRELRIQSQGRPLRVFYAFDSARQAVVLIGGDKTGISNARFYATMVPLAERIWKEYRDETA